MSQELSIKKAGGGEIILRGFFCEKYMKKIETDFGVHLGVKLIEPVIVEATTPRKAKKGEGTIELDFDVPNTISDVYDAIRDLEERKEGCVGDELLARIEEWAGSAHARPDGEGPQFYNDGIDILKELSLCKNKDDDDGEATE